MRAVAEQELAFSDQGHGAVAVITNGQRNSVSLLLGQDQFVLLAAGGAGVEVVSTGDVLLSIGEIENGRLSDLLSSGDLVSEGNGLGLAFSVSDRSSQIVNNILFGGLGDLDSDHLVFVDNDLNGIIVNSPGNSVDHAVNHNLASNIVVRAGSLSVILVHGVQIFLGSGQTGIALFLGAAGKAGNTHSQKQEYRNKLLHDQISYHQF